MKSEISLPDLDNSSFQPLYIQLADILIEAIGKNNLKENESIPSENDLLSRYEISRSTIRQSFSYLEKLGRVQKIRGKGTVVKIPKHRQFVRGFQDIEAGIKMSGSEPSNTLIEVRSILAKDKWINRFSIQEKQEMLLIRRVKCSNKKPIALEERLIHKKIFKNLSNKDLKNNPIFNAIEDNTDVKIKRVTYMINSSKLLESEAAELGVSREKSVFRRIGTYFNQNEDQVMYSRLTFIADRVELYLEFHVEDDNWGLIKTT